MSQEKSSVVNCAIEGCNGVMRASSWVRIGNPIIAEFTIPRTIIAPTYVCCKCDARESMYSVMARNLFSYVRIDEDIK